MMITDGDFADHDVDEYDDNHHNFVRLKWFYFLWPRGGWVGGGGGVGTWFHLNAMWWRNGLFLL